MFKKILLILSLMLCLPVFAADDIYVEALDDYSSIKPAKTFKAKVLKDIHSEHLSLLEGDILLCALYKTKDPARGKRDAQIFFILKTYTDTAGEHEFNQKFVSKYSKTVLNIDSIKSISPKTALKKTAGTIGDHFFTGVSYGISFVDGLATNPEGNRLKSGAKQVYKDSFFSNIEKGEEVIIQKGDTFYLVTKLLDE